jgi:hypothetical protein
MALSVRRATPQQIPRIYIMKSLYLTPLACAALFFGCTIANAQTSSNNADTTKGNNLTGTTPADQVSTPPTAGQDKGSGNDLVAPKGDANQSSVRQAAASRPDFNALDTKKKGALTADDVKGNKWLKSNFAKCDSDHDGTLSRAEYAACK